MFANGPGDLGSIPGHVIPKTLKMVLDTFLLNSNKISVSRVKWSNPGKGVAPSPTPRYSRYLKREASGCPRLRLPTLVTYIWYWCFSSRDLGSADYHSLVITSRYTLYMHTYMQIEFSPVDWGYRIHQLHFWHPQTRVLYMIMRLQFLSSKNVDNPFTISPRFSQTLNGSTWWGPIDGSNMVNWVQTND